jgi:hypothetical protein
MEKLSTTETTEGELEKRHTQHTMGVMALCSENGDIGGTHRTTERGNEMIFVVYVNQKDARSLRIKLKVGKGARRPAKS